MPKQGNSWRGSRETVEKWLAEGRIFFGKDGKGAPQLKRYLNEVQQGVIPVTWWNYEDGGHNDQANKELQELFGDARVPFDTPKPTRLIKRMLQVAALQNGNEIILDFFAGSGTTAHAVMDLNAEDNGNRKWICVQIPEKTSEESEAHKAGFNTIADISRERIRRAGEKVGKGDVGFKSFALASSNYRQWNVLTEKDDEEKLKVQMKLFADRPLIDGTNEESVVYEILLKEGFDLNAEVKQEVRSGIALWLATSGEHIAVITLAPKLSREQVDALGLAKDVLFICLDSALDDSLKVNLSKEYALKVL